jgi:hypothetical protein
MQYSPKVLRNVGVEVTVAKLDEDNHPILDDDGEYVTEPRFIRFTMTTLAAIEELFDGYKLRRMILVDEIGNFYEAPERPDDWPEDQPWAPEPPKLHTETIEEVLTGLPGFDAALREKPFATLLKVLALVWKLPVDVVGEMLLPVEGSDYKEATTAAFAIATGSDPGYVGKYLALTRAAQAEVRTKMQEAMNEDLNEIPSDSDSPSTTGSESGSSPSGPTDTAAPSKSSGKAPRRKSASSSTAP